MAINVRDLKDRVSGPGKFEGEPIWTPYYYDRALEGEGEWVAQPIDEGDEEGDLDDFSGFDKFSVDAEESETFGLPIGSIVLTRISDQGFVFGRWFPNEQELNQFIQKFYGVTHA